MLSLIEVEDNFDFFSLHSTAEAWQKWKQYSCIEWNGSHLWILDLDGPDDDCSIYIRCEYCLATLDDLYGDCVDLLYGEIEIDGTAIEISGGYHSEFRQVENIPVNIKDKVTRPSYWYPEYELEIILSSRS